MTREIKFIHAQHRRALRPRRRQASLLVLLSLVAMTIVLTEYNASSRVEASGEHPGMLVSGLDDQARTVQQLVDVFMSNRDWTEPVATPKKLKTWQIFHPGAVPPVLRHEKQSDAAFKLMQLGLKARAAVPAMIQSLTNSTALTRQWAARQKNPSLTEGDIASADSENRLWAIRVLGSIGSTSPEVVPALVFAMDDPQQGYEASYVLIAFSLTDTNVLPAVIAKIERDPNSPGTENSVRVLSEIGPDAGAAVPVLIQQLERTNASDSAVSALCAIGPNAGSAVPALLKRYEQSRGDGYFAQRRMMIITLGRIGPAANEAVPVLLKAMRPYSELDAVRALWRIDPQYVKQAIGVARGIIQAQATNSRDGALGLLAEIGPPAHSTVPSVLQHLNTPLSDSIEFNAAWALWRIDPDQKAKVVAALEKIRAREGRYPFEDLPVDAAGALWQIEPERKDEFRPAIIGLLKQCQESPQSHGARAEMKPLLPALMEIVNDPKYAELRPAALHLIRRLNGAGPDMGLR